MRSPPSVVAATTGRASRETSRVLMRQLRRAMREPGPWGLSASAAGVGAGDLALGAPERRGALAAVAGRGRPGFWACWGEEPRSVPPRGSGSAGSAAIPLETSLH